MTLLEQSVQEFFSPPIVIFFFALMIVSFVGILYQKKKKNKLEATLFWKTPLLLIFLSFGLLYFMTHQVFWVFLAIFSGATFCTSLFFTLIFSNPTKIDPTPINQGSTQSQENEKLIVLGQVVGTVAHELRNPLGSIKNGVYHLLHTRNLTEEKVRQYLARINGELSIAHAIVNDILETIRSPKPIKITIQLGEILNDILKHNTTIGEKAEIETIYPDNHKLFYIDPVLFRQVLINLINNSIEASKNIHTESKVKIKLTLSRKKDHYVFIYQDDGPGIDEQIKKNIFDPFFTTKRKGTGLGLWMCRQIILSLAGQIEVDSEGSDGATFKITLPNEASDQSS